MAAPATEHVRNIVLVGQDGAGKTSLAEAMLHVYGKTPRMGTTHDGKSYLDYDEEEIRRHFTLGTSIAPIPYKDYKINLLDTSGQADFLGDTLATMQAAEMAMFVVDAVDGPQVMTTRLWHEAETMRLCRCVFINHIDREHANFDVAMATLHARFGSRLGAVTIPMGVDKDFKGVIDVLRMKARYFEGEDERVEEIPEDYLDVAQVARDKLCDLVAEADEDLMMKYLDGEEQLTQKELERCSTRLLRKRFSFLCSLALLSSSRVLKALWRISPVISLILEHMAPFTWLMAMSFMLMKRVNLLVLSSRRFLIRMLDAEFH